MEIIGKAKHWIFICLFLSAATVFWVVLKPANDSVAGVSISQVDPVKTKLKIGYQSTSLYQHIFVAKEQGFFKKNNLEVELVHFVSANAMMKALIAGAIDVTGTSNMEVALRVHSQETGQFYFIAMLVWGEKSYPDYLLTCPPKNDVHSLKELESRSIGRHPGTGVGLFLQEVLAVNNVDSSNISVTEIRPSNMLAVAAAKKVDAIYAMDPAATNLINSGLCRILVANPMKYIFKAPTPIAGTAVSKKIAENDPLTTQSLISSLNESINFIRADSNSNKVHEAIAKYTGMKLDIISKLNSSEYWTLNEIDVVRVNSLVAKFGELGLFDGKIEANGFILPIEMLDND